MALIGKLFGYGVKAVKYVYRGAKASPNIIFGKGADAFVNGARSVSKAPGESLLGTLWRGVKQGGKAAETSAKSFSFKALGKEIAGLPGTLARYSKAGVKLAGKKGTSKIAGGFKGFFKGIGKKMPLIGNLMLVGFELPNIVQATKEGGIGAGIAETLKAGARLTAASIGSVALAGFIPPIGSIVGFMAGDWLASKVVGKSYTEKKAEQEQQMQEQMAQMQEMQQIQPQVQPAYPGNPQTTNPYSNPYNNNNPYSYYNNKSRYADDIMAQGMNFHAYV